MPTSTMVYLPFNVYLDSKRVSILVLPTLPMVYLPFNVYLDSKRVSILIEAVLPTSTMLYLPLKCTLHLRMSNLTADLNQIYVKLINKGNLISTYAVWKYTNLGRDSPTCCACRQLIILTHKGGFQQRKRQMPKGDKCSSDTF